MDSGALPTWRTRPLSLAVGGRAVVHSTCADGGEDVYLLVTGFGGVAEDRPSFLTEEVHVVFVCSERVTSDAEGAAAALGGQQINESLRFAWRDPDGRYRLAVLPSLWLGDCAP